MKIDILTLFPGMFAGALNESMLKIAAKKGLADIELHNIRKWTHDRHKTADDKPFGGGPGMVMKVEPIYEALEALRTADSHVVLVTPQGEKFSQQAARELSGCKHLILICGHYEGFDERIRTLVDREISIGDYILTCGEIPAMVLCDAIVRLIPGVLGSEGCLDEESFESGMLEYPQYTRPASYKGMQVPEVLLCGDPKKIKEWQREEALKRTLERRPDLLVTKEQFNRGT
ncbi:MAG: tRNA (guanosine(37)-N1)-methyltransferase TrmD [Candidatus Omnitrophica bacterium]|nr:tRNA (guanosine(37)-N1)-methyltransferase TrmD [Candidatus Omnitrophota bacterium]